MEQSRYLNREHRRRTHTKARAEARRNARNKQHHRKTDDRTVVELTKGHAADVAWMSKRRGYDGPTKRARVGRGGKRANPKRKTMGERK